MGSSFSLRSVAMTRSLGFATLILLSLGDARGEPLVLSGTTYASQTDFLYGTWEWLRPEPQQTVQMRFSRDGAFFFNNFTVGLTHHGKFKSDKANSMQVIIDKSCDKKGCSDRNPPLVFDYPMRPTAPNQFYCNEEKWDRLSSQ